MSVMVRVMTTVLAAAASAARPCGTTVNGSSLPSTQEANADARSGSRSCTCSVRTSGKYRASSSAWVRAWAPQPMRVTSWNRSGPRWRRLDMVYAPVRSADR